MNGGVFAASDQSLTWTSPQTCRQTDRAAHFTKEEQTIILDKYEEVRHLIQSKINKVEAAKCRKDSWQKKNSRCVNA